MVRVQRALEVLRPVFPHAHEDDDGDIELNTSLGITKHDDWALWGSVGPASLDQIDAIAKAMRILQGEA